MQYLSQRDPRWSFKTIGQSKTTIGAQGCVLASLSMLSDYFKCFKDPAWMAKNLSFLVDRVLWQSVSRELCFKFIWRFYKYDERMILDAIKEPDKACLLNVYNRHWVVAIRKVPFGYWVADPWDAKGKFFKTNSISGGAIFNR